ncbi:MAG: hypothetical protein ACI9BW_000193 [Gammaproteobacteria bacterium]|jgi:hypothetical protein
MGDLLAPVITERLFDVPVHRVYGAQTNDFKERPLLAGLGSILANFGDLNVHVWGAGYEPGYIFRRYMRAPGSRLGWKIHAVRGPHTAAVLRAGSEVVLGDPGLLVPRFYEPKSVQHEPGRYFTHCENKPSDVTVDLPTLSTAQEAFAVVDAIVASDFVFTEALHVAIVAQAFKVPWAWSLNSHTRGVFKWFDWFASIGIEPRCFDYTEVQGAKRWALDAHRRAQPPSSEALLRAFPRELLED